MALTIATNTGAINAAAAAQSTSRSMEVSMERLSTGKRINSASDDVSGLGSASRMTSEIRGSNQSIRNALDAQALVNVADGAHKEVDNILQRMREIAVQAANDTNNGQDRANLQGEMDAMVQEIDRIASNTTWAGAKLMDDAGGKSFSFMVGAAPDVTSNVVPVTITRMNATGLAIGDGTNSLVRVDDATLGDGSGDGRARAGIDLIDTASDQNLGPCQTVWIILSITCLIWQPTSHLPEAELKMPIMRWKPQILQKTRSCSAPLWRCCRKLMCPRAVFWACCEVKTKE